MTLTRSKWILLAEDNERDADLALRSLVPRDADLNVILATDGLKALDCLYRRGDYAGRATGFPAVVILDIKMPKVDGLEVLRKIKGDPHLKVIPVVIFTSSREQTDVAACYESGANAYVVKPVGFPEFRDALQQMKKFWLTMNELPESHPSETPRKPASLATAA